MLYIAGLFDDEVLKTIIHYECFPVREINEWLFIQCWDTKQSLVVHILGLDLIHFIILVLSHTNCFYI